MAVIHATRALLANGWAQNVRLTHADGQITGIDPQQSAEPGDTRVDTLLPALGNLHSHAFQRAMAGMTEHRQAGQDSFWTWRALMYRFMDRLTPEQFQAIAAQVYVEMLEAGFASVGEFHYVHHQAGGAAYENPAELSLRIFDAARQTGIGLTHLPVLYTHGGAGLRPLSAGQLRFGNDLDGFLSLHQACAVAMRDMPDDICLGVAPHSLRATNPADLAALCMAVPSGPLHIHVAEQPAEVADVMAWLGARPVEWLLANHPVDARWCLIHATHMTPAETGALACSGAVAGLCPMTEANLGDGPFDGARFVQAGGRFGIGSDSNVRISVVEELRMLEYSQRLRDGARNVMIPAAGSVGAFLYTQAARGGAQALGRGPGRIAVGALADLVAIDSADPALCALGDAQLLDGWVFAGRDGAVRDVWSAGRHMVQQGRHVARETVFGAYRQAMATLLKTL